MADLRLYAAALCPVRLLAIPHVVRSPPLRHRPSFAEIRELARGATLVPVYRQLLNDTLTPVMAFCKIQEGEWSFLYESVVGGEKVGRYRCVGSGPFLRFEAYGNRFSW